MTVCIVDTSVVVELLGLPGHTDDNTALVADFEGRQRNRETFLLPIPVLLETGNHVAQLKDGRQRRASAEKFIEFARRALLGTSPFTPTPAPSTEEVTTWLDDFAEHAMSKIGLVDRSLIDLFERQRALLDGRRDVYIWSFDGPLMSYDTRIGAPPKRR